MNFEFMTIDTPLPPCMPFPRALTGFPVSSTATLSEFAEENNLDESLFKAILRKMDFERVQFEKDIKDFSGGQKKKVLIAKSLCEKAHLYVWDEPLNFIDVYSRMQIEQLITEFAPTMLLVEHDSVFEILWQVKL